VSLLKIGDLVKIKGIQDYDEDVTCIIISISQPSLQFPYQVVTVMFKDRICDGILAQFLEKIK